MSTAGRTGTAGPPRPARDGGPFRTASDAGPHGDACSPGDADRAGRRPIGLAPGAPAEAAGQDAAKYGSSNPVVRRLLDRWAAAAGRGRSAGRHGRRRRRGRGLCLERLLEPGGPRPRRRGRVPPRQGPVARRLAGVSPVVADAACCRCPTAAPDVVTCIEVLEHLPAVAPAVAELARVTTDRCVVSVPWEPWFRLGNLGRGKNVRRLGNDPEHVQWFTPRRLRRARLVVHGGAGGAGLPVDHRGGPTASLNGGSGHGLAPR